MTKPDELLDELSEENQVQITSLLDSNDNGFFTHYFSKDLKTANFIFTLDSSWARGRAELVMVSVILQESEPDYDKYEKMLSKFVDKIKANTHSFKGFYSILGVENLPEEHKEDIIQQREFLDKELTDLYKILVIKKIETEGQLISLDGVKESKTIKISKDVINKLENLTYEKDDAKNCFLVFRSRGNAVKLDIMPVEANKIFRLAIIFGQQVSINILQLFSKIFSHYDERMNLIFTSGLCQESDKCIYEVYLDTDQVTLNKTIQKLYDIPGIIEIEVELIQTSENL
ncbi:MAG: hypothetical protein EU548_10060 [Promethearchaeota archaeon]|nr:MAG: hypothetical protein EU548_10060 [Candidatus Lokiarchaeota archaeon]